MDLPESRMAVDDRQLEAATQRVDRTGLDVPESQRAV